ncbi:hypothetical protein CI41S_03900 [Bradyrhizobium ivorense]|nr:hypothetical protein CI41S_03900 [Bradyrhizobium ivorense]
MPVGFPPGKPFVPAPKSRTIVGPGRTTAQKQKIAVDERRLHFELGKLVRRWSWLHEQLASVFQLASGTEKSVALAIWHSSKSDAAQRDMLIAALSASIDLLKSEPADSHNTLQQQVFAEFLWITKEIGKSSYTRNDLIHSPISLYFASGAVQFEAIVTDAYSNPRAKTMAGKELFQLTRWLISFCEDMSRYLASVHSVVRLGGRLPARPRFKARSDLPTQKEPPLRSRKWRRKTKV